ncbi:MAG: hypothetical protein B7Z73_08865 [Planctomycetia bacterium 21-64-5]|nr:MAG: hypothetical protein B7Z73_08865 [Planctomycetia bacterium 21-64-5]
MRNARQARRPRSRLYPFQRAILSGLGVVLPPLLTVVIFLWVGGTIKQYALEPVTEGTRNALAWYWARQDANRLAHPDVARQVANQSPEIILPSGERYVRLPSGTYVPETVKLELIKDNPEGVIASGNLRQVYRRYVELHYLQPHRVIPLFICVFMLVLYVLGKLLGAGLGRMLWNLVERGIHRVPLVRNVYDSVKQMTDFMFNERELGYKRVVAVEYPRKGVWALGFVTGESLLDIRSTTGEPMVSLMIPSSPMSVTGYIVTVPKSETIDLDLTIDQALQFLISCGVVVPPHQLPRADSMEAARS